jgi:hypothetical protein
MVTSYQEERLMALRRERILVLLSQGRNQTAISNIINVPVTTVNKDCLYIQSKAARAGYVAPRDTLPPGVGGYLSSLHTIHRDDSQYPVINWPPDDLPQPPQLRQAVNVWTT